MAHEIIDNKKNSLMIFVSMDKENLLPLSAQRAPGMFYLAGKTLIGWIIDIVKMQGIQKFGFLATKEDQSEIKKLLPKNTSNEEQEIDYEFFDFQPNKGIDREVTKKILNYITKNSIWLDGNVIFSKLFFEEFLRNSQGKNKNALVRKADNNEEEKEEFMGISYFAKELLENNITKARNAEDIFNRVRKKVASYFATTSYEKGKTEFWKIKYLWNLLDANQELIKQIETKKEGEIEDGVTIIGQVSIGKGARIRSGSYLEGPLVIGEDCDIGPNCYLRKGVSLGRKVRIGNACELKNTIVFDDTHIAHLSYVGDSIIGEKCNFGAGTITGNLRLDDKTVKAKNNDKVLLTGRRKLGVIMGDNVKTAINTYFMPGVIVGNNSAIGTGVILSRNLPDNSFITVEQKLITQEWNIKPKKKN